MKRTLCILSSVTIFILLSSGVIDLGALLNYANQSKPTYIVKDNTAGNSITNARATLGRVLFYDKNYQLITRLLVAVATSSNLPLAILH